MAAPNLLPVPTPRLTLLDKLQEANLIEETLFALDTEDIDPDTREQLGARLVEVTISTKEKVDRTNATLAWFDAAEAAADAEIKRLNARKKFFARNRDRLEAYMLHALTTSGRKSVEGFTSTLSWKMNPEKLDIADGTEIPAEFLRTPKPPAPEPDKDAIKRALNAGMEIEGCRLTQSPRLVRS